MIEIKNLTLQRGLKVLLEQAALSLAPGRRVGLIGKNGSGKSSLFALLKGEITADKGDVSIPKHWKTAAVAQETPALDISALDYVLQGDGELQLFQTALHEAEAKNDGMKQAEYHAKLEEIDAYSAPARAAKLLSGLGFSQEEHSRPVKSFSGGWRGGPKLAQARTGRGGRPVGERTEGVAPRRDEDRGATSAEAFEGGEDVGRESPRRGEERPLDVRRQPTERISSQQSDVRAQKKRERIKELIRPLGVGYPNAVAAIGVPKWEGFEVVRHPARGGVGGIVGLADPDSRLVSRIETVQAPTRGSHRWLRSS